MTKVRVLITMEVDVNIDENALAMLESSNDLEKDEMYNEVVRAIEHNEVIFYNMKISDLDKA